MACNEENRVTRGVATPLCVLTLGGDYLQRETGDACQITQQSKAEMLNTRCDHA